MIVIMRQKNVSSFNNVMMIKDIGVEKDEVRTNL